MGLRARGGMRILVLVLLLLLGGLQYRLWVGEGSLAEVTALRREIQAQKEEIERLQTRNRRMQAEVEDLRQGLDALEERARSELGMIKEGELFLQLVEPNPPLAGGARPGGQSGQTAKPPAAPAVAKPPATPATSKPPAAPAATKPPATPAASKPQTGTAGAKSHD